MVRLVVLDGWKILANVAGFELGQRVLDAMAWENVMPWDTEDWVDAPTLKSRLLQVA